MFANENTDTMYQFYFILFNGDRILTTHFSNGIFMNVVYYTNIFYLKRDIIHEFKLLLLNTKISTCDTLFIL